MHTICRSCSVSNAGAVQRSTSPCGSCTNARGNAYNCLRAKVPNILFQMLLRASNGVGYTNYPDNVVKGVRRTSGGKRCGRLRVFDSLNWVENMRVAMDAVIESGKICEAVVCYTGDIFDESRPKYNLDYYIKMARELKAAGTHILGIKDMAGL